MVKIYCIMTGTMEQSDNKVRMAVAAMGWLPCSVLALAVFPLCFYFIINPVELSLPVYSALAGTMALLWVLAWCCQFRCALLSELFGFLGVFIWFALMGMIYGMRPDLCSKEIFLGYLLLGCVWQPLVMRQRLVFGVVVALSLVLGGMAWAPQIVLLFFPWCMLPLLMLWWLAAERMMRGRWQSYSWCAAPCFLGYLMLLSYLLMSRSPQENLFAFMWASEPVCAVLLRVAPVVFCLCLKPGCIAWRPWLAVASALILPPIILLFADLYARSQDSGLCMVGGMSLYLSVALVYAGVRAGRTLWVSGGYAFILFNMALNLSPLWMATNVLMLILLYFVHRRFHLQMHPIAS